VRLRFTHLCVRDADEMLGWAEGFLPKMLGSAHGSALFAFALPD
jgi:hypothetical protein